jgi:hypothetical protein
MSASVASGRQARGTRHIFPGPENFLFVAEDFGGGDSGSVSGGVDGR